MDLKRSKKEQPKDPAAIEEWQRRGQEADDAPDHGSATARLVAQSISVYREIVRHLPKSGFEEHVRISLERSYGALVLWDKAHGMSLGDLDEVMSKSRALRVQVLETLMSLARTLVERLTPLCSCEAANKKSPVLLDMIETVVFQAESHGEGNDDGDDANSECFSLDSIPESLDVEEIAKDLATDTECLMQLEQLLQSPVYDAYRERTPSESPPETWNLYCERITRRFPQADADLILCLGRANQERFLRCKEKREATAKHEPDPEDTPGPARTVKSSVFPDSAIGSSIFASSYAETVMSYRRDGGEAGIRVPPLSDAAKGGKPFECLACGRDVSFRDNGSWKKHIFTDLQPYMCLDLACSKLGVFYNKDKWMAHLELGHSLGPDWTGFTCSLCLQETGDGKLAIIKHLAAHLEEISLAAIMTGAVSDIDSEGDAEDKEVDSDESIEKQSGEPPAEAGGDAGHGSDGQVSPDTESVLLGSPVGARSGDDNLQLDSNVQRSLVSMAQKQGPEPVPVDSATLSKLQTLAAAAATAREGIVFGHEVSVNPMDILEPTAEEEIEWRWPSTWISRSPSFSPDCSARVEISSLINESGVALTSQSDNQSQIFVCAECGRSFDQVHKLNHHKRYHERPHVCSHPGCNSRFGTKVHLDRHVNDKHNKTRKYYCIVANCTYSREGGKSFPRKDNWRRHIQNKHDIQHMPEPAPQFVDELLNDNDP